jgi:hypothetical protein
VYKRKNAVNVMSRVAYPSPSDGPSVLSHELFSPAQTLGSWVRIPLEAQMSACKVVSTVFEYRLKKLKKKRAMLDKGLWSDNNNFIS